MVTEYLDRAGLTEYLDALGFNLVGYGCTTCIGNSGPLPDAISKAVGDHDLAVVSVLSGNRNFEGRINPDVKMNYLASPPLVVAYAIAGSMDVDLHTEPLGEDDHGEPVYLKDIWPSSAEIAETIEEAVQSDMFRKSYGEVFDGDERWNGLEVPTGELFAWDERSTYVRRPPFFDNLPAEPEPLEDIVDARVLAVLGDSVTTDHISPAGSIKRGGPAALYLNANHVEAGGLQLVRRAARQPRGDDARHLRQHPAAQPPRACWGWRAGSLPEGGVTLYLADGTEEEMPIYDAAMRYQEQQIPLIVLAGKEYGSGSSRDWAAKGTRLLGVRAVIAESFERIHRSNLVGMGVLPLQFKDGDSVGSLGLSGHEKFTIAGLAGDDEVPRELTVSADERQFPVTVRIDTPKEQRYFRHGGILQFVLRELLAPGGLTMAIPELLAELLNTPGPSGQETAPAAVWREWCQSFAAEVDVDLHGSSWARVAGHRRRPVARDRRPHRRDRRPRDAHRRRWLPAVRPGGRWDPVQLVGQRIVLDTRGGAVRGVIGRKAIHQLDEGERKQPPELKNMHIDIGAASGDEARERVRIGDMGVIDVAPVELPNNRVVSRSLDNRVGAYVAARRRPARRRGRRRTRRRAGARGRAGGDRTERRTHLRLPAQAGRRDRGRRRPRQRHPGRRSSGRRPSTRSAPGRCSSRGSTLNPRVFERLYDAAEQAGIPVTIESHGRSTFTDADAIQISRAGVPTTLVSVPLRYMHSAVETVCVDDIEATAQLIAAFARNLTPGISFAR